MRWLNPLGWQLASACLLPAALVVVVCQPSAALVAPSPGAVSSTLPPAGIPQMGGATPASTSDCNGPTFSPPTSTNTTYAGRTSFLPLATGVATPNLWNVQDSAGEIQQCYNVNSGFKDRIDLSSLSLGPAEGPAGFPEIGYGESSYGEKFCGAEASSCERAPFPIPVSSFSKYPYRVTLTYSVGSISPTQYLHLTYDLWLERSVASHGPQASDVELMIEPYNTYPACGVARPAFSTSGVTWDVFEGCGASKATTLHFVLKSSEQRRSGTVTVNLSSFVT